MDNALTVREQPNPTVCRGAGYIGRTGSNGPTPRIGDRA